MKDGTVYMVTAGVLREYGEALLNYGEEAAKRVLIKAAEDRKICIATGVELPAPETKEGA